MLHPPAHRQQVSVLLDQCHQLQRCQAVQCVVVQQTREGGFQPGVDRILVIGKHLLGVTQQRQGDPPRASLLPQVG
jgi:hypothetical protein